MFFSNDPANPYSSLQQVRFADGTVWDSITLLGLLAVNTVTGTASTDSLLGTASADRILGLDANDTITALAGNDWLDGGLGSDTLLGGAGNDTYVVDVATDVVTELTNEGIDTVRSSVTWTLGANVENLILTGAAATNGTGNSLANRLFGNAANNVLDGGAGADLLVGQAGNDTYIVDSAGDVVVEQFNEGTDTVSSALTWVLGDNIENLTLTGTAGVNGTGNELNNVLIGNAGANVLIGGAGNDSLNGAAGADTMAGGLGNDSYVVDNIGDVVTELVNEGTDLVTASLTWTLGANIENLTLSGAAAINGTGNALNNTLTGNGAANVLTGAAGNDVLNGGQGADTLIGGLGDDSYVVDNVGDVVTENTGEGNDTVTSSVNWTLSVNVENLTLTGTAAINGIGNATSNVITGNAGANRLDGGAGADTLIGGAGADIYVFAVGYGVDTIQENDAALAVKDVIQFSGVTAIIQTSVQFKRVVDNLEVLLNGTADKLVIQGWYLSSARQVEEFRFTDGTLLTSAQVQAIATTAASLTVLEDRAADAAVDGDATLLGIADSVWLPDPLG